MCISNWTNEIHEGDAQSVISEMPESSIHCVVTSPPYFGLRDYGIEGQMGLEENIDEYINNIVSVGNELSRVLREDGSWWLNLGDTFYTGKGEPGGSEAKYEDNKYSDNIRRFGVRPQDKASDKWDRKSKMMIPHRVAIALQDSGWVVRSDSVWSKPNAMPDAVKDRFEEKKEFLFHLTNSPDYYYNEKGFETPAKNGGSKVMGDVRDIPTCSFSDAHFAVFPPELINAPIKATCPKTVCSECGSTMECSCDSESKSGIVLDPFIGSGTTAVVAEQNERDWIGIDLNPDYCDMAIERIEKETGFLCEDPLAF